MGEKKKTAEQIISDDKPVPIKKKIGRPKVEHPKDVSTKRGAPKLKTILAKVREDRRETVIVAARAIGIQTVLLRRLETGCEPLLITAMKVSRTYGKPIEELWPDTIIPLSESMGKHHPKA